ncbi:MAG: phage Gp37/Gp68 family protein [Leptospira sp.]|nr:phage Gp37/Gp68 family protein [Leptospira sp.]
MNKTGIEWTDGTWNPVTGCTKVSAGCANCYAATFANRGMGEWADRHFSEVKIKENKLLEPLRKKKPQKIFVNSMSDLFHNDVPLSFIQKVFDVMNAAHWHTFQILTKRPERMVQLAHQLNWSDNIWMGVSIEDQKTAEWRIPFLLNVGIKSRIKFLSCEPLIGPVDLMCLNHQTNKLSFINPLMGTGFSHQIGGYALDNIDWVIVGAESGTAARSMDLNWAKSIRNQCYDSSVAFFMKQICVNGKKRNFEDFPLDLQGREFPR